MLDGVRVVELGVWVAGPAAGGVLADWGADVIKVEAPAGDPMRRMLQTRETVMRLTQLMLAIGLLALVAAQRRPGC